MYKIWTCVLRWVLCSSLHVMCLCLLICISYLQMLNNSRICFERSLPVIKLGWFACGWLLHLYVETRINFLYEHGYLLFFSSPLLPGLSSFLLLLFSLSGFLLQTKLHNYSSDHYKAHRYHVPDVPTDYALEVAVNSFLGNFFLYRRIICQLPFFILSPHISHWE